MTHGEKSRVPGQAYASLRAPGKRLPIMVGDPQSRRVQQLTARAHQAGYRLFRSTSCPHRWRLHTITGGEMVHVAKTLDELERDLGWQ
jgi:hypothetical protein